MDNALKNEEKNKKTHLTRLIEGPGKQEKENEALETKILSIDAEEKKLQEKKNKLLHKLKKHGDKAEKNKKPVVKEDATSLAQHAIERVQSLTKQFQTIQETDDTDRIDDDQNVQNDAQVNNDQLVYQADYYDKFN